MGLDLRLPIGWLFSIIGALLVLYGLVSNKAIYAHSLGININLWWGLVLIIFGGIMLFLAHRASRAAVNGEREVGL